MKQYKKLQSRYHEKVKAQWRAKIKCAVVSAIILFVVACFIGLVVGLSLGLKDDTKCDHDYQLYCSGNCRDVRSDDFNCGRCGNVCPFDAVCMGSKCVFCTFNCSADDNFCTIQPCNITTGCSLFNCDTDSNPCTTNPCNVTSGGCTALDCNNDGDYCTVGICDPSAGGCAQRNCNALGDPCLTDPCIGGTCSYQCPRLTLNPPSQNYNTAVNSSTGSNILIVPSTLTLSSVPLVRTVTVSFSPAIATDSLSTNTPPVGITSDYNSTTRTLALNASPALAASDFQTALRTLVFNTNGPQAVYDLTFTFQVTNNVPRNLPSAVTSTVKLRITP